jgi:hypothetical protein
MSKLIQSFRGVCRTCDNTHLPGTTIMTEYPRPNWNCLSCNTLNEGKQKRKDTQPLCKLCHKVQPIKRKTTEVVEEDWDGEKKTKLNNNPNGYNKHKSMYALTSSYLLLYFTYFH